jgi:hypothetical protein
MVVRMYSLWCTILVVFDCAARRTESEILDGNRWLTLGVNATLLLTFETENGVAGTAKLGACEPRTGVGGINEGGGAW